jgi:hypothetical protein
MSEYTPDTENIRQTFAYVQAGLDDDEGYPFVMHVHVAEFDRWLASVKADAYRTGYNKATADIVDEDRSRKAKADAWDEGCDVGWDEKGIGPDPVNPYRGEQA